MYIVYISVFIIHYIVYNTFTLFASGNCRKMRKTGRNFPAGFNNGKKQIISPSDSELLPSSPHPLLPVKGLHLYAPALPP